MTVNMRPNSIWITTINGLFCTVHVYACVCVGGECIQDVPADSCRTEI